ncbi:MAG: DUF1361 domain-containing protein [Micrococcales bacterium]|nr:DUF1361 domain-containing protein [Micrococcales bacterium]
MLVSLLIGVVVLNLLALALVVARGPVFGTRVYRPMLLNLVLSAVPLLVLIGGTTLWAVLLAAGAQTVGTVVIALAGVVWLLLLPNAGYLITELNLSHRRPGERVPEWYDVLLVLTLAMSGVLTTVLNVFLVQLGYVLVRFGDSAASLAGPSARVLVGVLLVLVAFGVYLGRNVRVSSWDVLRPWRLVGAIVAHLRTPGALGSAIGFTLLATVFFTTMYLVIAGPMIQGLIDLETARPGL